MFEALGDDLQEGRITGFRRSVKAQPDKSVVFAFVEWPDKRTNAGRGDGASFSFLRRKPESAFLPYQRLGWEINACAKGRSIRLRNGFLLGNRFSPLKSDHTIGKSSHRPFCVPARETDLS